jgi:hypothetical protein
MRRCPHRSGRKPERGAPIGIDNDREQFGITYWRTYLPSTNAWRQRDESAWRAR